MLDADIGKKLEAFDRLLDCFGSLGAVVREPETGGDRFLDFPIRAAEIGAMLPQHVELLLHSLDAAEVEQIAGVAILGNEAQRLFLAAAADQNRRTWPLDAIRRVDRLCKLVMRAGEWRCISRPHLAGDLQRFFQSLKPLLQR